MGGGVDSHGHRPARPAIRHAKLKMLFVVIATNLVSVYLFSGASLSLNMPASAPSIHLWDSTALLRDLNATRDALSLARAELAFLRGQCGTSSLLLESVLAKLGAVHGDTPAVQDFNGWPEEPSGELKMAIEPHRLPLGYSVNFGTDELFPGLGFACRNFQEELTQYMTYNASAECPDDEALALQLMLKGCEPLPRRRCRPRSPASLVQRLPFADGVLDIVHSMHVLTNSVPAAVLEFAFFDIYRVLRPGGVFWLDHFFCLGPQLNATYVPILDRVGFRRLRWKASRKLDLGAERNEWYVSALLEKPMT
uniref:Methyltransferase type 11 domain-containing protein n=1 Tax=Aegilops tauschii TaxID=37682 RepID=R7W8T0_AEGTA